ncbi:MAG: hypothetical protein GX796_05275 [Clostridiaceae bacterium]|jgi:hypothetical protein|nr:hypothetical protein [Clostridiaceae bacterium]
MDDFGLFGLNNINDVYRKLEREYNALKDELTTDKIVNFVITSDSFHEWINKDKTATKEIRRQFHKLFETDQYKLINDMANRAKHFVRREKEKGISKDKLIPAWDFSDLDFCNISLGSSVFEVEMNGKSIDIMKEISVLYESIKKIFA